MFLVLKWASAASQDHRCSRLAYGIGHRFERTYKVSASISLDHAIGWHHPCPATRVLGDGKSPRVFVYGIGALPVVK